MNILFYGKLSAAFQLAGRRPRKLFENTDEGGAVSEADALRHLHNTDSIRQKLLRLVNSGLVYELQKAFPGIFFVNGRQVGRGHVKIKAGLGYIQIRIREVLLNIFPYFLAQLLILSAGSRLDFWYPAKVFHGTGEFFPYFFKRQLRNTRFFAG